MSQFFLTFGQKDSESLKGIADQLGIDESEVIRKALRLMALYAKKDCQLIIRKGEEQRAIAIH